MSLPLPASVDALLSEAECAQIDATLLPTRDRFSIRLKVYTARYLSGLAKRLDTSVELLTSAQITAQLKLDPNLQQNGSFEEPFAEWFGNLLTASRPALKQIANEEEVEIAELSLAQIIDWHQRHVDLSTGAVQ